MNLTRVEAIRNAQDKLSIQPIYLDTETTGLDQRSEIIEIAIIDSSDQVLFNSLVRPLRPIPADAILVHGITNSMVKDQPTWSEIWPEIQTLLAGQQIGIYNADFDLRMIKQTLGLYRQTLNLPSNTQAFCIMKIYAQYRGEWDPFKGDYRWHSLDRAGKQLGIHLPNKHRALDDTRLAKAVLESIAVHG